MQKNLQESDKMATLKKIKTSDLKAGMRVIKLDASWFNHPFLFSRRERLITEEEINRIKQYQIEWVWIDPSLGSSSVKFELDDSGDSKQTLFDAPPKDTPLEKNNLLEPEKTKRLSNYGQELGIAYKIYSDSLNLAKEFMTEARLGKAVHSTKAEEFVDEMVASIARNPNAMLSLTKLRFKNEYTYTHCVNVSTLSIIFGQHLGLGEVSLWKLGMAGLYHDVGKAYISKKILNKPGKLTASEYEEIKKHSLFGYEIMAKKEDVDEEILLGILDHHERVDGKGYPRGLAGEHLSWTGEMLGVVDVYDAMTSNRVYHKARLPTEVLRILYQERSGSFLPEYVESFIKCLGIYPPGTFVLLSNGEAGLVCETNPEHSHKPSVKVIFNRRMKPIMPIIIDLADEDSAEKDLEIIGHIDPAAYNIAIERFL